MRDNVHKNTFLKLTRGGLFMKGRDVLFSAFKAVVDLTTLLLGANATAELARRERAAIFIMVGLVRVGAMKGVKFVKDLLQLPAVDTRSGIRGILRPVFCPVYKYINFSRFQVIRPAFETHHRNYLLLHEP